MENKEILVSITVPDDQVRKATQAIIDQREAVDDLKKTNAELATTVGKNSQEYVKNEATIKRLNTEIQQNQRTLIAAEKAVKANDGSIRALREQLSAATAAYVNMSAEERDNTKEGKALQKQTRALSDELKKLESAIGNNSRNVGNYTESFKQAVTAQNGMAGSALKLFDTMKANPILFIVGLFVQLIQKVGATQAATDALNKILMPLNTMFERFVGILQNLTTGSLKDFGEALIEWVVSPFRGVAKLMQGIVTGDIKRMKEGLKDLTQNYRTVGNAVANFSNQMADARKQGQRLAEITKSLTLERSRMELLESNIADEIQRQGELARNAAKSTAEREAASKRVQELEGQRLAQQLKIQDLLIEEAKIKAAQNDTDDAAQLEIDKLISARTKLISDSNQRTAELRNQVAGLQKADADRAASQAKQAAEAAKRAKEQADRERERLNQERTRDAQAALKLRLDTAIKTAEQETQIAINALKKQFTTGAIDREAYEAQLTEIQRAGLAARLALTEEFKVTDEERLMVGAEFAANIEADLTQKRLANEQAVLAEKITSIDKAAAAQKEADKKAEEDAKQLAALKMQLSNQILSNTLEVVGRESAAGKAVASFQAALNAYQAFNAALAQPLPPPLPQILAASNLALGLAQVAKINGLKAPKFADGVIGLDGPGNATSDSIAARLSRGESVMTAKATTAFAPVLAQMERLVGNRPNYNYSRGKFATGVIGSRGMAANFANLGSEPTVTQALQNFTVVTRITDIDRVNRRRERVVQVTEID